jgi:phospholipase C
MRLVRLLVSILGVLLFASGCTGNGGARAVAPAAAGRHVSAVRAGSSNLPQHVIVIVQENRSFDNLFQGFPGADTQSYGYDSKGKQVQLKMLSLGAAYDPVHSHHSFVLEFDDGKLDGFDLDACSPNCPKEVEYSYVDPADTVPYWQLASQYALADHVLQPNEGPSFPAHIYLVAGQSGSGGNWSVSENPKPSEKSSPLDCLAPPQTLVEQIDMASFYPGREGNKTFPCVDPPTIFDEMDAAGISWKYYTPGLGGLWTAPYAIKHLADNPQDEADVITPETTIFSDIAYHTLSQVSYVIPKHQNSDHPGRGHNDGGPAWVASIVNAVAADNYYWPNTAIIVTWDDWGGWFDHYLSGSGHPAHNRTDPYEYGLRVPLIAIGPYAKSGYISHTVRDSTAILHFIEDVYGLPSLGTLDAQTDDLFELFDFGGSAHAHKRIDTGKVTIQQLRMQPPNPEPIDSE